MSDSTSSDNGRPIALADLLRAKGDITSQAWYEAFAGVPREVFVPRFATYHDGPNGTEYRLLDGSAPQQYAQWLELVYSDTTLITQVNERPVEEVITATGGHGRATSSSTAPGLMARLLEALDVHEGHTVLEIGTGSGFNAALLSHRLGAEHVTTLDIDADLTAKAYERLAIVGQHPAVHTVDGRQGWPANAPYERVIATCSTPNLPYAWVEQTCDGGKILANIAGALNGAMVLLEVRNGRAEGRFLPQWAGFMWARPGFTKVSDIPALDTEEGTYDTTAPRISADVLGEPGFTFLLQLVLPDARPYWAHDENGGDVSGLITPDGSWAEYVAPADDTPPFVEQGGPGRLWSTVEETHTWWTAHRQPDWSAFGVTVTPEQQYAWYGSADHGERWSLPG